MADVTPRVRIGEARSRIPAFAGLTLQTANRFDEITTRFENFLKRGFGVEFFDEVTTEHVEQFVRAAGHSGEPRTATMHMRRSSLRLLFRIARLEFDWFNDPTLELQLPPRSGEAARPLTNEEVVLGRSYSLRTLTVTRQPAAWALTEASATTSELPNITTDDLDLDNPSGPRVWLHGSRKRFDRWGLLDDWSATQLERRAKSLKGTKGLIYQADGSEESRQASCCKALQDTFIRCGLDAEPDVRPASLVAWAGVMALEETDRIEGVALRLGFRSLDAAARFIGYSWRG